MLSEKARHGNSLAIRCLGLYTFTAESPGSIPGQGTKIPQAAAQPKRKKKKKKPDTKGHILYDSFLKYFICLFGCEGSQLQQAGSLVVACGSLSCGMRTLSCGMHVGSSSLTSDRTQGPCIGCMESYPLRHQGSPRDWFLSKLLLGCAGLLIKFL